MIKYAKKISDKDNVVTAVADCVAGDEVTVKFQGKETSYTCNQDVPFGHKIAIVEIPKDGRLVKYGEEIGSASSDIRVGDWVHTHNVVDDYKCLDAEGKPLPGQEGLIGSPGPKAPPSVRAMRSGHAPHAHWVKRKLLCC